MTRRELIEGGGKLSSAKRSVKPSSFMQSIANKIKAGRGGDDFARHRHEVRKLVGSTATHWAAKAVNSDVNMTRQELIQAIVEGSAAGHRSLRLRLRRAKKAKGAKRAKLALERGKKALDLDRMLRAPVTSSVPKFVRQVEKKIPLKVMRRTVRRAKG